MTPVILCLGFLVLITVKRLKYLKHTVLVNPLAIGFLSIHDWVILLGRPRRWTCLFFQNQHQQNPATKTIETHKNLRKQFCQVIQSDLFGMVKWPFQGVFRDLQQGDEKGTAWNTWWRSLWILLDPTDMMAIFFHRFVCFPGFFCCQIFDFRGGNSNIFYFHPEPWGDDPFWRAYFSKGLVQPPTSFLKTQVFGSFFSTRFFECLQVVVQASPSDEIKTFNSRAESPQIQNDNRRTIHGSQVKLKFFFLGIP